MTAVPASQKPDPVARYPNAFDFDGWALSRTQVITQRVGFTAAKFCASYETYGTGTSPDADSCFPHLQPASAVNELASQHLSLAHRHGTDSAMSTGQLINARLAMSRLDEQEQGALAAAEEAEQEAAG